MGFTDSGVNLIDVDTGNISNAKVTLNKFGKSEYRFSFIPHSGIYQTSIPRGTYRLKISADGYEDIEETVKISDNAIQHYVLTAKGVFTGTVKDLSNGEKLKGVNVNCEVNGRFHSAVTNEKGAFRLIDLKIGSHTVTFSLDGYEDKTIQVNIENGKWTVKMNNIEMIPLSQSNPNPVPDPIPEPAPIPVPDYYAYIRDVLVPQYGWASLKEKGVDISAEAFYNGQAQLYWDNRKGIASTAVLDMNRDGVEDLLVLYFDKDPEPYAWGVEQYQEALSLYVSLYTADNDGNIFFVGTERAGNTSTAETYYLMAELAELNGETVLLVEEFHNTEFASDYSIPWFTVFSWWEDGAWSRRWGIKGSFAYYSIWDYEDPSNPVETPLSADYDYRSTHPNTHFLHNYDRDGTDPFQTGLDFIGFDLSLRDTEQFDSTAWYDPSVTHLLQYIIQCSNWGWTGCSFVSTLTDATASRERIDGSAESTPPPDTQSMESANLLAQAEQAYKNLLRSHRNDDSTRFSLVYIDGDMIPELLVFNGITHTSYVELYRYRKGEAVYEGIVGDYGTFGYQPKQNYFLFSHVTSRLCETGQFCSLAESGWNVIHEVKYYYDDRGYKVDGKDVTEETYCEKIEEYKGEGFVFLRGDDTEEKGLYALNESSYSAAFSR